MLICGVALLIMGGVTAQEQQDSSNQTLNLNQESQIQSITPTSSTEQVTANSATTTSISQSSNTSQTTTSSTSLSTSNLAAGEVTSTPSTYRTYTMDQILDASATVKSYIVKYHSLPSYVTMSDGKQVNMPRFLLLITKATLYLNLYGKQYSITLQTVGYPTQPQGTIYGTVYKAEYLSIAQKVKNYILLYGKAPNYATSTLGKIRYQSLIYTYSKILDYNRNYDAMPKYVIYRPVYITSDNITNSAVDTNRVNTIVNGLRAMGLYAVNWGLGPNTHYSVLSKVPGNALIVNLCGGACAGTIYEMGLSYYKQLVGNKKIFWIWIPPATNITGLAWLPRAHDDNFSPSWFTGLAHPDQYLLNNGYHYLYSGDMNTIITSIYIEAT
jgi:hypothetical protein